ncbi:MAG: hypothetical protein AAGA62_10125, partial [Bacteroidota bacterium]
IIYGLSGGGGNVLSAVTKFPYFFSLGVNYFGIGDYAIWYVITPSRRAFMQTAVGGTLTNLPNRYDARNSLYSIANFPNPIITFHDRQDPTVGISLTEALQDSSAKYNLPNVFYISDVDSDLRYEHTEASQSAGNTQSEDYWTRSAFAYTVPVQPDKGELKISGYLRTPKFDITLGDGLVSTGRITYDFARSIPSFELENNYPQGNTITLKVPGYRQAYINGCLYSLDASYSMTEDIFSDVQEPIYFQVVNVIKSFNGTDTVYTGDTPSTWGKAGYTDSILRVGESLTAVYSSGAGFVLGLDADGATPPPAGSPWYTEMEYGVGFSGTGANFYLQNEALDVIGTIGFGANDQFRITREIDSVRFEIIAEGAVIDTRAFASPITENLHPTFDLRNNSSAYRIVKTTPSPDCPPVGDGMGDNDAGGNPITSVGPPMKPDDAARKKDVDAIGALVRSGTGSPEGVVTAPVGTLFLRTDGATSTSLYIKESGSGNTGGIAK